MTPADEQVFIRLWQAGASQQALAQHLGVPVGTIKSRAYALVRQGKIQPRPRGGAYPHQTAQGRARSPQPVQTTDTGAVQAFDTGPVQRLDRLEDEVLGLRRLMQSVLERLDHPPV